MSLLSSLNTGTRGLFASQMAMDIAGQNISNADVEGYSRKRLNLSTESRYDSALGQVGMGVSIVNIERMRNTFIDDQIRRQNVEVGYFEEMNHTFRRIENIFTEPGDTGVLHFMDQFFDSWQNLANNPADLSARTMVKTNAEILTNVFHNVAGELRDLRQTRNDEITQKVNRINQITEQIYNLNLEIGAVEVGGQNANDSRDQRDRLLKELSKITDISMTENKMGQITVSASGSILVSPVNHQKLEMTTSSQKTSDGKSVTDIAIRFAESKRPFNPGGGHLKGLFDSRDISVPQYQDYIDQLALSLVEHVNSLHTAGYTMEGYSGVFFFDPETTGASDIEISASIASDVHNIAAASAGEIQSAVTNTVAPTAHQYGDPPAQLFRVPDATPPVEARNIVRDSVVVRTADNLLREGVDYHINYQNGTFQLLHNGYDDQEFTIDFNYRTGGFMGPGDNSTALNIAQLRTDLVMNPDTVGNHTSTFSEFYSSFIGKLGLSKNQSQNNLETREFLVEQYQSHQDSISAVSLDEEMANLIRYQHTYQASARLISTTDRMLDVLMNM
ncbi:flagellar hook-associated protein FlgK [Chitinispirillales bacterium ANBcel5]|uniref:flagellar hook-associated protein FlgK n=1 Tax=Cellulosispirillum alkaliphilum TaxID=3039283 RepID=UPI002A5800D1|nr:flagellar hook-associated protein FlgK [Chitinispirillales bacterium ANBcel5]